MALPDFLVAGVPKAGTTALHAALSRHPDLYMSPIKEPKFFLTDGPPPAKGGPGDVLTYREHVWQQDRYEALFDDGPGGRAARRVDPALPVRPGGAAADQGPDPGGQAHRDPQGPGRAGALQLDAPVVGGPGAGRRLHPGLRRGGAPGRRRLGIVLALHRARQVRGAARLRVLAVPPRAGARPAVPPAGGRAGRHARPDLRLPRRRPGRRRRDPQGERNQPPGAHAGPPRRVARHAGGRRGRAHGAGSTPRRPRRTGWSGSCSATAGNDSRSAGTSARRCCRSSRTTSSSWRRCSARTSATGSRRGPGPAAWSAPARPARARPRTAAPSKPPPR